MIMDDITIKEFVLGMQNQKLEALNMACEMMMFDFGIYKLHTQCLTRIIKGNDILVTTLDYQSWDGEKDTNNDEWYFVDKFRDEIVGGVVVSVELSAINDLRLELSNGIVIELFCPMVTIILMRRENNGDCFRKMLHILLLIVRQ